MRKLNRTIFLLITIFIFFFFLGGRKIFQPYQETKQEYEYLKLFTEVVSLVKNEYVEDVKADAKFPGAFSSMLNSLDPYSSYLDPARTELYNTYKTGHYFGCGIFGTKVRGYFYISDIEKGSPADKAGLKTGDLIKAVNGSSIYSLSFWEMYLPLLSRESQTMEVTLFDRNAQEAKTFSMQSAPIKPGASIKNLKKNILLVKLTRFDEDSVSVLKKGLKAHKKPLKLIVDLRQYAGGDLESFKEITKLFFNGPIPLTIKKKVNQKDIILGSAETDALKYKVAVVINQSTRMYGELLAALFKRSAKTPPLSVIVGSKSRGFISNLKSVNLEDGSSILITDGLVLLDGKAAKGVTPDVKIKNKEKDKIMKKCISFLNKKSPKNKKV